MVVTLIDGSGLGWIFNEQVGQIVEGANDAFDLILLG